MQPEETPSIRSPQPLIILVHGTFARNAPWTWPESPLPMSLRQRLGNPKIQVVQWTGHNTFLARIEASEQIINLLQSVPPNVPVALISHSHGGSAVCYAAKRNPRAFENVHAVVCLATPFFGFSVRPGYQALLFGIIAAIGFLVFQGTLAAATVFGRSMSPRFDEYPFYIAAIGLCLLLATVVMSRSLWVRRARLYQSFTSTIALADSWDTTQVVLSNALFARSMGDEVGLGLGTLQFVSAALNKLLNVIARVASNTLSRLDQWRTQPFGKVRLAALLVPFVIVSALPAAMAANFGYHPRYWIDILNPWSASFSFVDPVFGAADHSARLLYAMVLLVVVAFYILICGFALFTLVATALSWVTTGAFGCFSLRLAVATQWAVEPTPEGRHTFLNGGWGRNPSTLREDRIGLQHSEPYTASTIVESVVAFVAERLCQQRTSPSEMTSNPPVEVRADGGPGSPM